MTVKQAAAELEVSPYTFRKYIRAKLIPVVRINKRVYRIQRADLDRFIQRRRRG